ncbi:hypothetical protein AVEN_123767-1 [Araneus ventricosus]|uniref:Uncharacterized protein n=1 Tax=Araneus ventricosus TaxID=182803 RepID=A0A4Y2BMV8_ARAVE|nr:hypothetical protein AVEN_123767-1 [Araneus ventricosus]
MVTFTSHQALLQRDQTREERDPVPTLVALIYILFGEDMSRQAPKLSVRCPADWVRRGYRLYVHRSLHDHFRRN